MKSLKFLSLCMLVLSACVFLPACKKDNGAASESCKIITVSPSSGNGYNITYNAAGKPETVATGKTLTVFSYSGNIIIANTTILGNFITKTTITLNPNGLAANAKTETSADGSTWYKNTYEYNGTEIIKDTYTNSQNVVPEITTVNWSGGNLVSFNANGVVSTVEYYNDKPSQDGDYLSLNRMIQGYKVYSTKNAIKSFLSNGNITSFEYNYQDGKINAMKFVSGGTITNYNYQYQCK